MANHNLTAEQLTILRNTLSPFVKQIELVGLFGSRATGQAKSYSDIDLVLYGDLDEATIDRIWTLFEESSLPFKVDVCGYACIDYPPLKAHIDEVMVPLFTKADLL